MGGEGGGFQALVGRLEGFLEGFEFGGLGGDDALPGVCQVVLRCDVGRGEALASDEGREWERDAYF